jgi:hypothetical protein
VIERVVTKRRLYYRDDADRAYWLSPPVADRIAHVEALEAACRGWTDATQPRRTCVPPHERVCGLGGRVGEVDVGSRG